MNSGEKEKSSRVSPNVIWTFIPAVSASLKNAVFALYFIKTSESTQKIHYYFNSQTHFFSLCLTLENMRSLSAFA